jgi:hypothetical protein
LRGLLLIATTWCTGEVAGSIQVMGITDLRAHPGRILIVFGAPIAFAITGLLHLVADGDVPDIYSGLKSQAGLWIAIHVVQLLLILLLAVAVYWLTEGLTSTAARISRVALLPYLVFYSTFDAVVGLSNGLVVRYGSELPPAEQAVLTGGQRRPCEPHTSTRAPNDLSHWHLVVGGGRHRRCSCAEPSRSSANCNDSIGSGRSCRSNRSCCTFWTSRDAAIYHRRLRAQSSGHGPAYV